MDEKLLFYSYQKLFKMCFSLSHWLCDYAIFIAGQLMLHIIQNKFLTFYNVFIYFIIIHYNYLFLLYYLL